MRCVFITYTFSSLPDKLKHHVELISQVSPSLSFYALALQPLGSGRNEEHCFRYYGPVASVFLILAARHCHCLSASTNSAIY